MRSKSTWLFAFLLFPLFHFAQMEYEASDEYPYGRPNPEAPEQIKDFAPMIGECKCRSLMRNPDQTWADTLDMTWRFKYIMNGMGVQDETFMPNGRYAGSIRQFIADSSKWYVHFYSSPGATTALPAWEGGIRGDSIVLYREQKAPNGMDGFYRVTFKDMTEEGYNWIGEWVDTAETFSFPTWKIWCARRKI